MKVAWVLLFAFTEIYSIGVAALAKKAQLAKWWRCLIPFVAFFYMDKLTLGYKALGIKVSSFGKLFIILVLVSLGACLYSLWGMHNLTEKNIVPLIQIMCVPIAFCAFVLWINISASAKHLLFLFGVSFKLDWLVCISVICVPILFIIIGCNRSYVYDKSKVV